MSIMFGLREAGVLGASLALAGGVAYLVWNYTSSSSTSTSSTSSSSAGKKPQKDVKSEQPVVVPAAAQPVVAAEPEKASEPAGTQVLVLGLDGAGKTSLLNCFSTGCLEPDVQPTQGFNAVSINREDLHIEFLEIGGKEELRPYWRRYLSRALLLVFVVDSSNPALFPVAKTHLHELLASEPRLPLMVLANKQDLPGSCGITDLHEALSLSEVGDRRLFLIDTYVKKGEAELGSGVQDARDLIIQMVCDGR
ncbi:ADP-ribosylation factor-like protein 9 [Cyclopterus lumpus]|uniref:ADP-ribosylation factor-like 9 n=1 Tax=Cyclopterus lumpus TaxID=8103 RepID=A0A8C2ZFH4_CYCLU|nr:ADP-ribosylation factor-like protein 9 [Cyclopterus lumpus]